MFENAQGCTYEDILENTDILRRTWTREDQNPRKRRIYVGMVDRNHKKSSSHCLEAGK